MMKRLLLAACVAATSPIFAQLSLTTPGAMVTADISDYEGAGFQPGGGGGTLNSDIWAAEGFSTGSVDFGGTATSGDLARGIAGLGTVTTGGIYALVSPTPTHIWIQPTTDDFTPGSITARLQNNTAINIGQLAINYTAYALNDEDRSNSLVCQISTDNITYTEVPGSLFVSPDSMDLMLYETSFELIASGFSVAPGDFIYVRWTGDDVGGSGSRDEFGLSTFAFTGFEATVVPFYNFEPAEVFVDESAGGTSITFSITESADCTFNFSYDPASTATPGFDYGLGVFSYTFTAGGPTSTTLDIGLVDDVDVEGTETGIIYVSDVTGACVAGLTPSSTINIVDNDSTPVAIATFTTTGLTEDEAVGSVSGTISMSFADDCVFQLYLDGASTMENGLDYSFLLPTFVTFTAAGPTEHTFDIPIIDDLDVESTEMLLINMIPWTGTCVVLGIGDYEIHIEDNDVASIPTVSFVVEADSKLENEGSANTNIVLSESSDCSIEITGSGTAVNGLDYSVTLPASIDFTAGGATSDAIVTTIIDDLEVEPSETIVLTMEVTGGSCVLGDVDTHTITIIDDDEVAIQSATANEIIIAPNPATDWININGAEQIETVEIYYVNGQVVYAGNERNIDIHALPSGNYTITVQTQMGVAQTTFIKQ